MVVSVIAGDLAGPVTMLFIGSYMNPSTQGFHHTFMSLLALQSFVDLGLSTVIAQFAAFISMIPNLLGVEERGRAFPAPLPLHRIFT